MGNCNSNHPVHQRCQACVGKWREASWPADKYESCPCTAGLDHTCATGKCAEWQKQTPGLYDEQYKAWLRANPEPVKPEFVPIPDIVAGDFVCTQCTQCQDFSRINANNLTIDNADQVMTCIGKMESASAEAKRIAAEVEAAKAAAMHSVPTSAPTSTPSRSAPTGSASAPTGSARSPSSGYASRDEEDSSAMIYVVLLMLLVFIAVIIAIVRSRGSSQIQPPYGMQPMRIPYGMPPPYGLALPSQQQMRPPYQ